MNKRLFPKLALTNLRKNRKTYYPYILTSVMFIAIFYNIIFLTKHPATGNSSLSVLLMIGTYIIAFFSVIFLFYTNSFLIKRRKKEYGLFNILGMEKKHIAKIMLYENLFVSFSSIVLGLATGILFSKLFIMILTKILAFTVTYHFYISGIAIGATLILFSSIFFLSLLNNLLHIYRSKPIELLKGGNVGEKEPKSNLIVAILGAIFLGTGYYIALTTKSPLEAFTVFFIAVIFVMLGTIFLFTAGSITILKLLRKNKTFYYQKDHFISVSGMIYRMKKNAVGLANICILSTAVIIAVSTTVSLFAGMDDIMHKVFPYDITLTTKYDRDESINKDEILNKAKSVVATQGRTIENLEVANYFGFLVAAAPDGFSATGKGITKEADGSASIVLTDESENELLIFSNDNYEQLTGKHYDLQDGEVLLYSDKLSINPAFHINDFKFTVKERLPENPLARDVFTNITNRVVLVVKDENIARQLYDEQERVFGDFANHFGYYISFDTDGTDEEKIALSTAFEKLIDEGTADFDSLDARQAAVAEFLQIYGGLFFLGIFFGLLFLLATVLIIYYKQVTEGYEDRDRFVIMQKVGMSKGEVKKSIRSQILTVFFIPIAVAMIHVTVAFPIMTKLLAMLNLSNIPLFATCTVITVAVFAVIYAMVFMLTAKVYYKIVNQ